MDLENSLNEAIKIAEEDVKDSLQNKKPINDYILLILIGKKKDKTELEKLQDYDDVGIGVYIKKFEVFPPSDLSHYIHEIRQSAKRDTPTAVITVETIKVDHKELMEDFYEQYISGEVKEESQEKELIIRVESYKKTIRKFYKIFDGELNMENELSSDGKKFLPYLN